MPKTDDPLCIVDIEIANATKRLQDATTPEDVRYWKGVLSELKTRRRKIIKEK